MPPVQLIKDAHLVLVLYVNYVMMLSLLMEDVLNLPLELIDVLDMPLMVFALDVKMVILLMLTENVMKFKLIDVLK